ncbi:sterol desaturase family protein [Bacillus sp. FSL W7-1360]
MLYKQWGGILVKKYLIEYFSHKDVLIMNVLFMIGFIWTWFTFNQWTTWVAVVAGMATYALSEYSIHRFLFHMKPPKNLTMLKLIKRLHYDHHVTPNDLKLLFLPVWYSLPLISIAFGFVLLMTGQWHLAIAFTTGLLGYLLFYEWTHYVAHRPIVPKTAWGRWMKKLHLLHHFKNENYWYGVTNPSLDLLMGTFEDEKNVDKSKTAKNLEQREREPS